MLRGCRADQTGCYCWARFAEVEEIDRITCITRLLAMQRALQGLSCILIRYGRRKGNPTCLLPTRHHSRRCAIRFNRGSRNNCQTPRSQARAGCPLEARFCLPQGYHNGALSRLKEWRFAVPAQLGGSKIWVLTCRPIFLRFLGERVPPEAAVAQATKKLVCDSLRIPMVSI